MASPPVALVTGGNRGIGRETCRQLAARGHHVSAGARDLAKGQEAADAINTESPDVTAEAVRLDVTSDDVQATAALVGDRFGRPRRGQPRPLPRERPRRPRPPPPRRGPHGRTARGVGARSNKTPAAAPAVERRPEPVARLTVHHYTVNTRSLPVRTWLRLVRVAQKVGRAAEAPLADLDLSAGQFALLAAVGADEGALQDDLAGRLATTKGNVSQLLAKLGAKGLVRRVPDGRTKAVHLTPDGRALLDREVPAHDAFIEGKLSALSADELDRLHALLARLDRSLD